MRDDKIACACHNVTYGAVRKAVEQGAKTVEQVAAATGAGTACGKCREFLEYLIRDLPAERSN